METYRIVYTADAVQNSSSHLSHHGVKGQKWGIRRTPEQLGHRKPRYKKYNYSPKDIVFVSGKVKFDDPIPQSVKNELDNAIKAKSKIIIGDAPRRRYKGSRLFS